MDKFFSCPRLHFFKVYYLNVCIFLSFEQTILLFMKAKLHFIFLFLANSWNFIHVLNAYVFDPFQESN